jgi:hypothetical protein
MKTLFVISSLLFFISCITKNTNENKLHSSTYTLQNSIKKDTVNPWDTTSVSIFLDCEYWGEIHIYGQPNGRIIETVKNDSISEDNVMFRLLKKTNDMFYVTAYWALSNEIIGRGWIPINNHLGIFSSTYDSLTIYKKPNKSRILMKDEYNANMYEVVDFQGRWLKIRIRKKGKVYEGWIPPEEQCNNVYSTCS